MATCPVLTEIPECGEGREKSTILYEGKEVDVKWLVLNRRMAGFHTLYLVHEFEMEIGFDEMLSLFFTGEFQQHVKNVLETQVDQYRIIDLKHDVIRKFLKDFEHGLHSREFVVKKLGTKLHATNVSRSDNWVPSENTNIIIRGSFEF